MQKQSICLLFGIAVGTGLNFFAAPVSAQGISDYSACTEPRSRASEVLLTNLRALLAADRATVSAAMDPALLEIVNGTDSSGARRRRLHQYMLRHGATLPTRHSLYDVIDGASSSSSLRDLALEARRRSAPYLVYQNCRYRERVPASRRVSASCRASYDRASAELSSDLGGLAGDGSAGLDHLDRILASANDTSNTTATSYRAALARYRAARDARTAMSAGTEAALLLSQLLESNGLASVSDVACADGSTPRIEAGEGLVRSSGSSVIYRNDRVNCPLRDQNGGNTSRPSRSLDTFVFHEMPECWNASHRQHEAGVRVCRYFDPPAGTTASLAGRSRTLLSMYDCFTYCLSEGDSPRHTRSIGAGDLDVTTCSGSCADRSSDVVYGEMISDACCMEFSPWGPHSAGLCNRRPATASSSGGSGASDSGGGSAAE